MRGLRAHPAEHETAADTRDRSNNGRVWVIAGRDDPTVQADFEAGTTGLTVSGGLVAAIGVASLAVAIGLLRHSSLARSVCTIVAVVQAATSVYGLVSLDGIRAGSVWSFASAVAVLWFLYGSERTQAYFAP